MQKELNIHALECFTWSYINRIIFLAHKQEESLPWHRSSTNPSMPKSRWPRLNSGRLRFPTLTLCSVLLIKIRGTQVREFLGLSPGHVAAGMGSAGSWGGRGHSELPSPGSPHHHLGTASVNPTEPPRGCCSSDPAGVMWSIPHQGHSTSPSTPGLQPPSHRSLWPSPVCPSALIGVWLES